MTVCLRALDAEVLIRLNPLDNAFPFLTTSLMRGKLLGMHTLVIAKGVSVMTMS